MQPWFIATERFGPADGEAWRKYLDWSGLNQLEELVSLDPSLCPTVLPNIKDAYWPHIVNENFMLDYFVDYDFFAAQIASIAEKNVLCVFRDPSAHPAISDALPPFRFVGYDLVDVMGSASSLSNCRGFPEAFANSELNRLGLIESHARAVEIQTALRRLCPRDPHADCHVWAIFRLVA